MKKPKIDICRVVGPLDLLS